MSVAPSPELFRLCLVVGQLRVGGLERQVYLLASALDRRRFDVTVVSLGGEGSWSEGLSKAGVRVRHLRRRGHWDWRRLLGLARMLRSEHPHLAYSFNYETNAYTRLAGLLSSVPILVTGERGVYMTRWQGFLERLLIRVTECVICNAEAIRQDLIGRVRLPPHKLVTIPNAVEMPPPASPEERDTIRRALRAGEDDCVVGTIARLDPIKNLPMMIEAAAVCTRTTPRLRFCVVGSGPEETGLRALIRERGLADSFFLLGERVPAARFLSGFDVFVLTSWTEGLPNGVMEAMAASLPCVCTDVGGCRELVDPGRTGYLIPSGGVQALADRILDLAGDPERRRSMGQAGRRRIEGGFSVRDLTSRTERILMELIAAKDSSPRGHRMAARCAEGGL